MPSDILNPLTIQQICRRYRIRPQRERGQHFIIKAEVIEAIVRAAQLTGTEEVLEIGPGLGGLTEGLLPRVKRLVAVELDRRLVRFLRARFPQNNRLILAQDDIRTVNLNQLGLTDFGYAVVANLPFQVTALVLRNFLSLPPRPNRLTLVIQREVAERVVAPAGGKSLLTVSVEYYGQAQLVEYISRRSFWPEPEVDSALLTIDLKREKRVVEPPVFFRLAKAGFSSRRKMLRNSLAGGLNKSTAEAEKACQMAGINPRQRPEELTVEDWERLAQVFV